MKFNLFSVFIWYINNFSFFKMRLVNKDRFFKYWGSYIFYIFKVKVEKFIYVLGLRENFIEVE